MDTLPQPQSGDLSVVDDLGTAARTLLQAALWLQTVLSTLTRLPAPPADSPRQYFTFRLHESVEDVWNAYGVCEALKTQLTNQPETIN